MYDSPAPTLDGPRLDANGEATLPALTPSRSLTDVSLDQLEDELRTFAAHLNAATAQWLDLVAEFCRREAHTAWGLASVIRRDDPDRIAIGHERRSVTKRINEHGNGVITIELAPDETHRTMAAIDALLDRVVDAPGPFDDDGRGTDASAETGNVPPRRATLTQRRADAFLALIDERTGARSGADRVRATIDVDLAVLARDAKGTCFVRNGPALAAETARRLTCESRVVRTIPRAARRAVARRDKECCQFPGCTNAMFTAIHHIVHWACGDDHALTNLVTLCNAHHRLVHEGGFRTAGDGKAPVFLRPDDSAKHSDPMQLLAGHICARANWYRWALDRFVPPFTTGGQFGSGAASQHHRWA